MNDVTQILSQIEQGDPTAAEHLLPLVYDELRKLAAAQMAHENPGQTLQPTALVHEAYIRLVNVEQVRGWDSRGHFFSAAAEAMRRILVEQARRKQTLKRGGQFQRKAVDVDRVGDHDPTHRLLEINEALDVLATENRPVAELVKLRYFAGLTLEESASALGVTDRTAYRYWAYARAWLYNQIHHAAPEAGQQP